MNGKLAYLKDDQVWTASLDGKDKPERLFFDRGKDSELCWSPDGARLAFVSRRGDHAFIGIFTAKEKPLLYLAPSTGSDSSPRWSPDGSKSRSSANPARQPPGLTWNRLPIRSIIVANADSGAGLVVWKSPETLAGSFPDVVGGANLHWAAGDRLVFLAYLDDWPHLYSIRSTGGTLL